MRAPTDTIYVFQQWFLYRKQHNSLFYVIRHLHFHNNLLFPVRIFLHWILKNFPVLEQQVPLHVNQERNLNKQQDMQDFLFSYTAFLPVQELAEFHHLYKPVLLLLFCQVQKTFCWKFHAHFLKYLPIQYSFLLHNQRAYLQPTSFLYTFCLTVCAFLSHLKTMFLM